MNDVIRSTFVREIVQYTCHCWLLGDVRKTVIMASAPGVDPAATRAAEDYLRTVVKPSPDEVPCEVLVDVVGPDGTTTEITVLIEQRLYFLADSR